MNSIELLPSEENIITALNKNILNRNKDLVCFYDLLLAQETSGTIAIDGRWGSGKTFFVKQSNLVINALNPASEMDEEKRMEILSNLPFKKTDEEHENFDLAIYYDAWKNDNDTDPVMSIVYEITKQLNLTYTFEDKDLCKLAGAIVETISGRNVNGIIEQLKSVDPLAKFKEQKELEEKISSFFGEILIERGNRLIVFIDELDRCKPSFAVKLLEQIKHYLSDDRVTFVFSVNLDELQHTIRHYYGESFDACRYLDRFFNLRIELPPAKIEKFYEMLGLNSSYTIDKMIKRICKMYNFQLREITRFCQQVKAAVYSPTHGGGNYDFSFSEGRTRYFLLMYMVPLVIGLRIVDISLYDDFVNGKNDKPLKDLFAFEDMIEYVLYRMLNRDESFEQVEGKALISYDEKIESLYRAIFATDYTGNKYREVLGECEFDASSKSFLLSAASMMSHYADYTI